MAGLKFSALWSGDTIKLDDATEKKIIAALAPVMKKTWHEEITERAIRNVPIDSGKLRQSIRTVGPVRVKRGLYIRTIAGGKMTTNSKGVDYAKVVEYEPGRGQGYMRKAAFEGEHRVERKMEDEIDGLAELIFDKIDGKA